MELIRDKEQIRLTCGLACGIALGLGVPALFEWSSMGPISGALTWTAVAGFAGWLGWRIGTVLPDLSDAAQRRDRWRRIHGSVTSVASAMTARRSLFTLTFGVIAAAGLDALLDAYPGLLVPDSPRATGGSVRMVTHWVVVGTAAVIGGWFGHRLDRLGSGPDPR